MTASTSTSASTSSETSTSRRRSVTGRTRPGRVHLERTQPGSARRGNTQPSRTRPSPPRGDVVRDPHGTRIGAATDAAFLTILCSGALAGLHTTFSGWWFLAVGLIGLVLGQSLSHLATMLKLPVLTVAAATAVVYFVVGPAFLDRSEAIGGALPSLPALRTLATASVFSWKQLLTTIPPAPGSGTLLAIPLILGLAAGAAGLTTARRLHAAAAPLATPVVLLGVVIALGTREPAQWTLTGLFVAVLCLCWAAVRAARYRAAASRAPKNPAFVNPLRLRKAVAATVLLSLATGGGLLLSPLLPGANGAGRSVLRDNVTPPIDLSAYPSPLVAFRKYTKDANQLWDQTLFTVSGLPAGTPVRIATLDDYNGSVWGATNGPGGDGFQRVGSTIDPADTGSRSGSGSNTGASSGSGSTLTGPTATVTITIAPAYAAAADTNAWLPTAGTPTGVTFDGTDASELAGSFRYNAATSSGLVLTRLQAGDTVTLKTVLTPTAVGPDAQPYGPPSLTDGDTAVFAGRADAWSKGAVGIDAQLNAVGAYLRENGAYSDGGPGETQYLPGHSLGRLIDFLNGPQPVGDDEQYAAAFALIANSLGMPARVVLGAIPEADGAVKGSDVHAWVEIHTADGAWDTIPDSAFMPDPSKRPDVQPPQPIQNAGALIVPPPNAIHPPGTAAQAGASAAGAPPPRTAASSGLTWLLPLLRDLAWVLSPVLVVLLCVGAVRGLKARRRRRRRTRGTAANRFAAGWRDLVDHARDLGAPIPRTGTRVQQAETLAALGMDPLGTYGLGPLAGSADAAVYGPGDPTEEQAGAFWQELDQARRAMSRASSRRRRLLAVIDIRTLLRPRVG